MKKITLLTLTASLAVTTAQAQDNYYYEGNTYDQTQYESNVDTLGADISHPTKHEADSMNPRKWSLILGLAGGVKPEYTGSDGQESIFLPVVIAKYQFTPEHSVFFSPYEGIGYKRKFDNRLSFGVNAKYRGGRDSSDDSIMTGMSDIDPTVEAGPWLKYKLGNTTLSSNLGIDTMGEHSGWVMNFGASHDIKINNQMRAGMGISTLYGNDDYADTYYSTTANPGVGRSAFGANGGLSEVKASVHGSYFFDRHTFVRADLRTTTLIGDAADSPISKEDTTWGAFLTVGYKF